MYKGVNHLLQSRKLVGSVGCMTSFSRFLLHCANCLFVIPLATWLPVRKSSFHIMNSILPSFTSVWHTLRDTGKTCHCIQGRLLYSRDVKFSRLQGCSYGRSVRCQAPMTAQRRSEHTPPQTNGEKHSFLASEETSFATLGLQNAVIEALHLAGYSRPSKVQVHRSPHDCNRHITRLSHATRQVVLCGAV